MTNAGEFAKEIKKWTKKNLTTKVELWIGGRRVASETVPLGKGGVTVVGPYKIDPKGKTRATWMLKDAATGKVLKKKDVSVELREGE